MNVWDLKDKYVEDMESYFGDSDKSRDRSRDSISSTTTTTSILPEWMSKFQAGIVIAVCVSATALTIFFGVYPFVTEDWKISIESESGKSALKRLENQPFAGLRCLTGCLHAFINSGVMLAPFFIWYFKNACKVNGETQKDLPLSQRTLFYSYSINQGM